MLLPALAAILWQDRFGLPQTVALPLFTATAFAFCLLEFRKVRYRYRWLRGLLLNASIFLLVCSWVALREVQQQKAHYTQVGEQPAEYVVQLNSAPVQKPRSIKLEVEVERALLDSFEYKTLGKAILYLAPDSSAQDLGPGDRIAIATTFRPHRKPSNPGQFDYGAYLQNSGVERTAYIRSHEWQKLDVAGSGIGTLIAQARQQLLGLLNTGDLKGEEGQIASALLLGYKEELDPELRKAFSEAGAMHVLAVSGLHVGIVFMALNFLLGWMERLPRGKLFKMLVIIALIWCYALLTGSSPSVLRASVMFSMIGLAGALLRSANIINTLAASAFVMLIWAPALLFNVGFQLSYSAVLGIVLLYPHISPLVASRYWLVNKMWDLTAVSIAAQLSTFPLTLYYFHQLPVYAFLSNLIIIPAAFGIIAVGGIYLVFSWWQALGGLLAKLLWLLLFCTNASMKWIAHLPYPVAEFKFVGGLEALLLYVLIIGASLFVLYRIKFGFFATLLSLALFIGIALWKDMASTDQHKLLVLEQKKGVVLAEVRGQSLSVFADSLALEDVYLERTISDAARHFRAKEIIWHKVHSNGVKAIKTTIDSQDLVIPIEEISLKDTSTMYIIPSMIPSWKATSMKELASDTNKVHLVGQDGAFIIEL